MQKESLIRAIYDDPDDDAPRLAFADWLEANGNADRANWVRVSCEWEKLPYSELEKIYELIDRSVDLFSRCAPPWWDWISNVEQEARRGTYLFHLGDSRMSKAIAPVERLGAVGWLKQAHDEGWLQRIEVHWCPQKVAELIAEWEEPAASVPLMVAPFCRDDLDALKTVLQLPQLQGLRFPGSFVREDVFDEICPHSNIRDLEVEFRLVPTPLVNAAMDRIVAMPGLRRLSLRGHDKIEYGDRPNDEDLLRLAAVPALRTVRLKQCAAVTQDGIGDFQQARPSVRVLRVYNE